MSNSVLHAGDSGLQGRHCHQDVSKLCEISGRQRCPNPCKSPHTAKPAPGFNVPLVCHKGLASYIYLWAASKFLKGLKKNICSILSYFLQSFYKFDINILIGQIKATIFYVGKNMRLELTWCC